MKAPRSRRGGVRLIVIVAIAALAAIGLLALSTSATSRELDENLAQARAEESRLAHVTKRSLELSRMERQLRERLAAQGGALPPACPDPEPPHEEIPATERPTALLPWDPGIESRRRELDARTASIQRGMNIERRVPEQERCLADLQARLAALPAP